MATRGPKPKPVEQAKRDGTHASRIPNPPLRTGAGANLEMPRYFDEFQQTAWNELVKILTDLDILDSADRHTVETCAEMIGRMRLARHELNSSGEMITTTQRGAEVPSPWWKIEREA
ncbi:MAG TPA: P27 family phage terminase small subunit, partial [Candidatus Paceibacterota bacterium]